MKRYPKPKFVWDAGTGAGYITLGKGKYMFTDNVTDQQPLISVDYDEGMKVIGIEIIL